MIHFNCSIKTKEFKYSSFYFQFAASRDGDLPQVEYNPVTAVVMRGFVPPMLMTFRSLSPGIVFPLALRDSASLRLPNVTGVAKLANAGDGRRSLHLTRLAGRAVEVHTLGCS